MKPESFLPFARPDITEAEIDAVARAMRSGWVTTGPETKAFESEFAAYLGGGVQAVAVNSATAGLHLALEAMGVGPGDEVIAPTLTFTATVEVARYLGADARLVDVDPVTLNIDPARIEAAITPRTKAILPVHYGGLACDMAAIFDIARRHGLQVLEDAAHALPTTNNGALIGQLASAAAVFSFYANKTITTGEGGMVTTDSDEYAERLRLFRTHGITKDPSKMEGEPDGPWSTEMQALGFNYRLSDIHAALGLSQMKKLDRFVSRRKEIASLYDGLFSSVRGLEIPPRHEGHAYHLYPLRVPAERRKEFILKLKERGIGGMVHYPPVHLHPYYRKNFGWKKGDFPEAEAFYSREISLPMFYGLSDDDVARVAEEIRRIADAG